MQCSELRNPRHRTALLNKCVVHSIYVAIYILITVADSGGGPGPPFGKVKKWKRAH